MLDWTRARLHEPAMCASLPHSRGLTTNQPTQAAAHLHMPQDVPLGVLAHHPAHVQAESPAAALVAAWRQHSLMFTRSRAYHTIMPDRVPPVRQC